VTTETYSEIGTKRPSIPKDPDAELDYTFDWADWLDGVSDSIDTHEILVDGVDLLTSMVAGQKVIAWLSGGTAGQTATATCRIVTDGGRTEDRTIYLLVRQR
jgi:hypothetical protein